MSFSDRIQDYVYASQGSAPASKNLPLTRAALGRVHRLAPKAKAADYRKLVEEKAANVRLRIFRFHKSSHVRYNEARIDKLVQAVEELLEVIGEAHDPEYRD